jgi:conjugative relaxase-like TrwC/TraI family protein
MERVVIWRPPTAACFTTSRSRRRRTFRFWLWSDRIIATAHDRAVESAVSQLEQFAGTRVRRASVSTDRETGNIVGALFQHDTSRALDPHLHSHCIVFNATYDGVENRWKACRTTNCSGLQKFVENVYYHELARRLAKYAYRIESRACGDFVIRGLPDKLRDRFSKRHAEMDEKTRDLLARNPEEAAGNMAEIREHIAQNERARKIRDISGNELNELWKGQLAPGDGLAMQSVVTCAQGSHCAPDHAAAIERIEVTEVA